MLKKTKTMIISKYSTEDVQLFAEDARLQQAERFNYLACYLNENRDHSKEVRRRIEKARSRSTK